MALQVALGSVGDLAVSPRAVYALYAPPGGQGTVATDMLARVDRFSGAVRKIGPLPGAARVAVGAGSVWVGGSSRPGGTIGVVRLDPDTLQQRASVPLPAESADRPLVAGLAASADRVWLAYGMHLYRLDPSTGAVQSRQSLDGPATSIAFDASVGRLYVGSDAAGTQTQATVTEWDAATERRLAGAGTGGAALGGPEVAAAADGAWVAFATGMLGGVEHRRASDLTAVPTASTRYTNSVHVYVASGFVWTADSMANQLACLDPATGAVRVSRTQSLGGVVAGDAAGIYLGSDSGVGTLVPDPRCRSGQ